MAITQVANPSSVPSAVADYEAQNAHISAFNNIVNNQPFILTNSGGTGLPAIKLGTYIQYGGNLYVVDTEDYAITGTPVDGNNYIRLSGTVTLTAEWVQNISSYVWNEVYGYKESGSYFLLPYLVVKDGTEYEKYSMALDASFGKLKATTLDTGQGANELYAMNQDVETTDDVEFNTVSVNGAQLVSVSLTTANTQAQAYTAITNIIGTSATYKACFGMIGLESAYIVTAGAGLVRIYSLNISGNESMTTFGSTSSTTLVADVDIIINKGLL